MDFTKLERRNSSLDILRIVAAFTVLSVHFFLHNGFCRHTGETVGIPTGDVTEMAGFEEFFEGFKRQFKYHRIFFSGAAR